MVEPASGARTGTGRRFRRHAKGFAWTGFDQALSSLSNVVVSVALARSGGADALGIFTVAFAAYLIALGMFRALVSEPLLTIPAGGAEAPDQAERLGATTAVLYVILASLVVVGVGLSFGAAEIVLMGLVIPLAVYQDFFRYLFFRRGRPDLAALLDGAWVVTSIIGWPLISSQGSASVALMVWATGSAVAVLAGLVVSRAGFASPARSLSWWWHEIRPLGGFLALDGVLFTLFSQITTLGLAMVLGTADLGTLRGAQIVLGPLGIVLTAFNVFALPRLSASRAREETHIAALASGGATMLAAVSTFVLWLAAPVFVPLLYGEQLDVPQILILAVGVRMTLAAVVTGPTLLLKARRRGGPIVVGRIIAAFIGVPIMLGIAAGFGLVPAVWASNVGTLVNLIVLAVALRPAGTLISGRLRSAPGSEID